MKIENCHHIFLPILQNRSHVCPLVLQITEVMFLHLSVFLISETWQPNSNHVSPLALQKYKRPSCFSNFPLEKCRHVSPVSFKKVSVLFLHLFFRKQPSCFSICPSEKYHYVSPLVLQKSACHVFPLLFCTSSYIIRE